MLLTQHSPQSMKSKQKPGERVQCEGRGAGRRASAGPSLQNRHGTASSSILPETSNRSKSQVKSLQSKMRSNE